MKISLHIVNDSYNSYSTEELEISINDDTVEFEITDNDRKISVSKKELEKVLTLIKE